MDKRIFPGIAFVLALSVGGYPLAGLAAAGAAADSAPAGGAGGANGSAPATMSFSEADRDSNGFVDEGEAQRVPGLDLAGMDSDQDGRLSRSEFEAGVQGAAGIDADVPPGSGRTDGATGEFGQSGPDPRGGEDQARPQSSQ